MKNRKIFLIFAVFFIILVLTPIALNKYYNFLLQPASKDKKEQIFVIKVGQPVADTAKNLKDKGLIKNSLAFRLLVSQLGISKNIQAGDFRLSPSMPAKEIAAQLTHGAIDVWVTIPEGLRLEEQAERIEAKLKYGSGENYTFDRKQYLKVAQEGYMFPDTYLIQKDATAQDVASLLRSTFKTKVENSNLANSKSSLTAKEIIILASIIEREAKGDAERPQVAGILMNRLNAQMPLQIDATVQYAKGYDASNNTWWPQVSRADYQSIKSPFNTYLTLGLPPEPICNPGLQSIKAASAPAQTDYYYYLHDRSGKIHYAKTIEEHNNNIKEFL